MGGKPLTPQRLTICPRMSANVIQSYSIRACGQIPRHSGLEPESRRFESNNDLMHILIDSGFRRNNEIFDFVHTP